MFNRRRTYLLVVVLMFMGILRAGAVDVFLGDDKEGNVGTVQTIQLGTEPVTLYDGSSATATPPKYSDYAVGVCFKADPGQIITVTFDEYDVTGVNVYYYTKQVSGIPNEYDDWDYEYTYTTPSGWSQYFYGSKPPTQPLTSDTGYLTLLWIPQGTVSGTGIKATVTAEAPGNMELISATLSRVSEKVISGQTAAPLYGLRLTTKGSENPLTLSALEYSTEAMVSGVENLKLCTLADGVYTEVNPVGTALATGNNDYYFVGDVKADATTITPVSVTSLIVGGAAAEVTTTDAGDIAVTSDLWMPGDKSWPVVRISDPRNFYDNGGPSAKIPLNTEGTITFVPADPSRKIKVDFSDFAVFVASIASNSDILKIFNGSTAAGTPIFDGHENPGTVKSTAEDGALTIYFKSDKASEYYAGAGWTATVSQYAEGPMTYQAAQAEAAETSKVTEGETGAVMAFVNVQTENALSPLTLNSIRVNTNSSKTSKVTLYSLGSKKDAAKVTDANKLTAMDASASDIDVEANTTLADGNNWFAVVIDVANGASNGEFAELKVNGVTVANEYHALDAPVAASATVENRCEATEGSHTHTISSEWVFVSEENPYSPGKYAYGTTDRIVTFRPAHEGGKIELNISEFDVYYASSSYGTRAKFEVRAGGANGTKLWELKANADSKVGPNQTLRSTADDGSLTVIFNPNTYYSSYTGKGWTGSVREAISKPQTVTAVEVAQSSEGIIGLPAGTKGHRLLDINVKTEGDQSPKTLKGMKLNLTGADVLTKVTLLSSGNSTDFATATDAGSLVAPLAAEVVIPTEITLNDGNNRLWITVDAADDIDSDLIVDAALSQLVFTDESTMDVSDGNPDGNSVTQNIYIMESDSHTVTVGRTIQFYDDGGPDANISMLFNGTVTFVPARQGEVIVLNTPDDGFGLGRHKFTVYNGREVSDETKIDSFMGVNGPQNVKSTAADGSLTVVVKTYNTPSVSGFHVEVGLYKQQPLTVENVVPADVPTEIVMRGAKSAPFAGVSVEVAGESGTLAVKSVNASVTAPEGTVGSLKLYATATPTFAADNLLAEAALTSDGLVTFTPAVPYVISAAGTYYLWVAGDVATNAAVGSDIVTSLKDITIGEATHGVPENTTTISVHSGIAGTFTLGKDGDYPNFKAASDALAEGVEGPVTFEVLDGVYHENIIIRDLQGSSADKPLIFKAKSGNAAAVIVSGSMPNANNDIYGTHKEGMVLLERSSFVTFSNMTFQPEQDVMYPSVMNIYDNSDNVTVDGCAFSAQRYFLEDQPGIKLVFLESPFEAGRTCDNFTVRNSRFNGGYTALSLQGSGYTEHPRAVNVTVEGNTLRGQYWQGIFANSINGLVIKGNTIENRNMGKYDFRGIDLYQSGFDIEANRMTISSDTESVRAINIRRGTDCSADAPGMIVNNAISLPSASNILQHGIALDASLKNVKVLHNTVAVAGAAGYPLAFTGSPATSAGVEIVNNLLQNNSGKAALYFPTSDAADAMYTKASWAGNCFYGSDVDDKTGYTIAQYAEKTGDTNATFGKVQLVSTRDLRPVADSETLQIARDARVMTDLTGAERTETTSRGAYQFAVLSTDAPVMAEGYPQVKGSTVSSVTAAVKWNVSGELYAVALSAASEAPTADDLLATEPTTVDADTEVVVTRDDLEEDTAYRMYFLMSTAFGGNSAVVASDEITTLKNFPKLEAHVTTTAVTIDAGDATSLSVTVTGGDSGKAYTYQWYDQMMQPVGESAKITVTPDVSTLYRVEVTSADNQVVWGKARIYVQGTEIAPATFDDVYLEPESSWRWDSHFASDGSVDRFFSGSFEFVNMDMRGYNTWGGFGYANHAGNQATDLGGQMLNAVGGGAEKTAAYGVMTPFGLSAYEILLTNSEDNQVVKGLYLTNSALTLASILGTTDGSTPFANGDYLEVEISGYDAANQRVGRVTVPLADYRNGKQDVLSEWKYVSLSELGAVKKLEVNCYSSQSNLNTLICMDQIGAKNPDEVALTSVADGRVRIQLRDGNILTVNGVCVPDILRIYSASGVEVYSRAIESDAAIALDRLTPGIYFAKLGAETLKFVIR